MKKFRTPMITRRVMMGAALGIATLMSAGESQAQTPIKLSLDWKIEGPNAPFVVALDKGYFKAEGLDVTIDSGSGSVEPLNRVASGSYDMAAGDINSLIKFLDKNPGTKIKAVYMLFNNPPFSVVGRKSLGIHKPKDLEGKKLGAPATDGAFAQWPIFVAMNNIDSSKVQIQNIGFPVRESMLVSGDVDAVTGFAFSSFLNVASKVNDATVFLMSDYGVKLYGNTLMVHPKFAAEKPEAVRGFLRALTKAIKETAANPEAAIPSVLSRNPVAQKDAELKRLKYALEMNYLTKEVKKNGLGAIDPQRMAEAIDQLAMTYKFDKKPTPAEIFDSSFLPPLAERTIQ